MRRSSWLGRAGEASAWAISAVAWALSFAAQMQLAGAHGFRSWEVWAWPLTTDLAGLVGMLIALDQTRRGGSTAVAWLIAIAAAGVMVAANIGAAVGDGVSMLMHAWPPSIALACWFLLVHVRRAQDISEDEDIDSHTEGMAATSPRAVSARQQVERLYQRHGASLTTDQVALRVGLSQRHASRLLGQIKRPRVVAE
jgi:hypothetical protein